MRLTIVDFVKQRLIEFTKDYIDARHGLGGGRPLIGKLLVFPGPHRDCVLQQDTQALIPPDVSSVCVKVLAAWHLTKQRYANQCVNVSVTESTM